MRYLLVDESFPLFGEALDRCETLSEALAIAQGCDQNVTVIEAEENVAELIPTGRKWILSVIPAQ